MNPPRGREAALAGIVLLLLAAVPFLPFLPQDQGYHHFADGRALFGVANALDTLSNVPFVLAGLAGICMLMSGRLHLPGPAGTAAAWVFFAGLIATGLASAWYHHAPSDAGLASDRYGMVIAFAGALGMAAAQKVGQRAAWLTTALALACGPTAVLWWRHSGNVAPYVVMQFGGMLVLVVTLLWRSTAPGPNWGALVVAYALAKVFEAADFQVFELTAHLVSGHTLKHLLAACAALAVIWPLRRGCHAPLMKQAGLPGFLKS